MTRILTILLVITLAACSAHSRKPTPGNPCIGVVGEDAVDGGIGGTGRADRPDCNR